MLAFGFVAVVMLFAGGANVRQLALLMVGAVIAVVVAFQLDILKDYQPRPAHRLPQLGEAS